MKISVAPFEHAVAALAVVLRFEFPADAVLSRYFREHRELGAHDRAFVAEAVFGVLRKKYWLDHITQGGPARTLLLAWLSRIQGLNTREFEMVLRRDDVQRVAQFKAARTDDLSLAEQAELPAWVVEKLELNQSVTDILALGQSLSREAPLDLRVNTLKMKRDEALARLRADSYAVEATPYSPWGLRLAGRPAIQRHALFLDGTLEVQDEGSQLLCALVAPTRHDLVIDFCAGAGGKTLALGALMANRGRLYAFDVSPARLKKFEPRLARSGLSNVHPQTIAHENDARVKRLAGKVDRVLIDAPCSGLGTLRRNPDLKWRQSPQSVAELCVKQRAILEAASRLVKPGGRLVYATCSLLAEENEAIVEAFLANNGAFSVVDCDTALAQQHISLTSGKYLKLTPHQHGTDGFFGAVIHRH